MAILLDTPKASFCIVTLAASGNEAVVKMKVIVLNEYRQSFTGSWY
jgi:hypothetical protein